MHNRLQHTMVISALNAGENTHRYVLYLGRLVEVTGGVHWSLVASIDQFGCELPLCRFRKQKVSAPWSSHSEHAEEMNL